VQSSFRNSVITLKKTYPTAVHSCIRGYPFSITRMKKICHECTSEQPMVWVVNNFEFILCLLFFIRGPFFSTTRMKKISLECTNEQPMVWVVNNFEFILCLLFFNRGRRVPLVTVETSFGNYMELQNIAGFVNKSTSRLLQ